MATKKKTLNHLERPLFSGLSQPAPTKRFLTQRAMTIENKDSKPEEVETPSEESADKKQPAEKKEEATSQKNEGKESLEERFAKLEKKSSDFEKAFYSEKKKSKGLELKLQNDSQTDIDEVRQKVRQELQAESIKSTFKKFIKATPELHEANDLDGTRYSRFKDAVESKLGVLDASDPDKLKKGLEIIYHQEFGTLPTQKDQSTDSKVEVVDSGIGDTPASIPVVNKQPDALTRPLKEVEKQAIKDLAYAKKIPDAEAEKLWRKKRAEIDEERKG